MTSLREHHRAGTKKKKWNQPTHCNLPRSQNVRQRSVDCSVELTAEAWQKKKKSSSRSLCTYQWPAVPAVIVQLYLWDKFMYYKMYKNAQTCPLWSSSRNKQTQSLLQFLKSTECPLILLYVFYLFFYIQKTSSLLSHVSPRLFIHVHVSLCLLLKK